MARDVPQRDHLNALPKQLADLFSMTKGSKVATCELWTHAFGWECRLLLGGEWLATEVCRNDAEIEQFVQRWKDGLGAKGWQ